MNKKIKTPYYIIDENKLLNNLKKIEYIKTNSGAKLVLALKCFSTLAVFDLMSKYMDGTTSSSLYEAKLGYDYFGKETHVFSVAYCENDIEILKSICSKIIFNSISQLNIFYNKVKHVKLGLRINPGFGFSQFDLANSTRKYSRLGVTSENEIISVLNKISGVMFHYNCENDNFKIFEYMFDKIIVKYEQIFKKIKWVSFGGGLYFTKEKYPLDKFCEKLENFSKKYNIQVYLEPGESSILNIGELVTTVLDIVKNVKNIAIVDASIEAHMPDLLIYRTSAKIDAKSGKNEYIIAGNSCLAGDIFGKYKLSRKLKIGSIIRFIDAAGYTIVKKNWFNGVAMPSIIIKRLNGKIEMVRKFSYYDFLKNLS
ncbi:MAG: carboxynorspermidine decarboxylase [Endomicrobium sp.]|jgi:carboxynorspermidine decarboxylase|nr:carboxynorspermidine decarboxylase [Endomicrobium sp.]